MRGLESILDMVMSLWSYALSLSATALGSYPQKIEWLMVSAPGEMSLVEGATMGGVGVVAISMLVISLFKRSAVAAVSFSFLALTTLILGMLYGRFDFLPMGTQTLLGCLFACSFLLFTTATIRLARENPFVGAVILMVIAALLVTGGGALLNMIDGRQLASFGLMIALALGAILMCVEIIRGDRPTLAMAPGLLCLFISPFLMRYIGGAASVTAWWAVSFPLMMLAVGAVYITVIAQIILSLSARQGVRAANVTTVSARTATAAAPAAVFGMHEVADEDHHQERSEFSYNAPSSEEYNEAMDKGDLAEDHVAPQTVQHEYAAVPQAQGDVEEGANVREEKETAQPTAPYQPISVSAVEPVSAQWGTTNDPSSVSPHPIEAPSSPVFTVADDEYVWDSIADQEVKVGAGFADLLGLTQEGRTLSPDVMRDALAPASLGDFDDAILGGAEPETGRFNLALTTGEGRVIGIEGRRQVDHDGILSRIEAQAKLLSSPKATSPMGGRDVDRMATAPLTATPLAASPIAQKTAHEQSAKRQSSTKVIEGLERGEIEAHFQPIVRLSDGKTVGFEALARWHHPNGDVQDAKDFVSDLIKADRGLDLARLVIDHAASELSAWIAAEPGQGQFVSVNIAAADMPKSELADIIRQAVENYKLPAGALVIELVEDRIRSSQSKALAAAKAIHDAGASLAIDDFGVGYSTLSRLLKFRFELIKLDKSLITNICDSRKKRSFIKAILSTARKSGALVIAEGVEDRETAKALNELGCDFAQGYLYGHAEPVERTDAPDPGKDINLR